MGSVDTACFLNGLLFGLFEQVVGSLGILRQDLAFIVLKGEVCQGVIVALIGTLL